MRNLNRHYDPNLLAIMNLLGAASLMGFLYCLFVLLHGGFMLDPSAVFLYLLWFAISFISVHLMKRGDVWGAYALGIATLALSIYEIVRGTASIGGAALAAFVMLLLISYIKGTPNTNNHNNPLQSSL